jgi:5-methylcytosine-specific restriction endonuclease McrA
VFGRDRAARRNRAAGTHCFYCGVAFTGTGKLARTIDHRLPRSAGGSERLANLVFACRGCNQRKADRSEDEFTSSDWLRRRTATERGEGERSDGEPGTDDNR